MRFFKSKPRISLWKAFADEQIENAALKAQIARQNDTIEFQKLALDTQRELLDGYGKLLATYKALILITPKKGEIGFSPTPEEKS